MTMRLKAATWVALGTIVCLLVLAEPVAACTCVTAGPEPAWTTLDQAAQKSDAVLVGRVLAQTTLSDPPPYAGHNVAYVDLEVVEGIKGLARGEHVRVWDWAFGASCSLDLRPLKAGTVVAMALFRNRPENKEYHELMRLKVGPGDYLLDSCGEYLQLLRSDRDADEMAARLREAVSAPSKDPGTTR